MRADYPPADRVPAPETVVAGARGEGRTGARVTARPGVPGFGFRISTGWRPIGC